ncbi:twin transmembrane helix small protein [Parvularcula sp. LCG005]|uniref:twin transmembrane helix small protein n=1 Tax=Parvularcula sp. LCG005 TaxID=3078805 RepID=UPI002943311F|nr:twin transmembrane helix small protein [Parvularcula sp. LCG005]WOI52093.1 twin transmembrane helix small protein [Parvularcula sp. LCG005]
MAGVFLYFLIPVALLATAIILGVGIYSLAKGGDFAKANSNKLMRMRVTAQAIAIVILMLFVVILKNSGN